MPSALKPIENIEKINYTSTIAEMPKTTIQTIHEEIQKAKDIKKLEELYEAGNISDFEYKAGKFFLNASPPV